MAAPMLTPDPSGVAGPGPGAEPLPSPAVPAVAPAPPVLGMPQMPGMPLPSTHAVGPKGPNFDPTGTVPVAGSPADPGHPAQKAGPAGLSSNTLISGSYPGLIEPGNIDLTTRPKVKNPDGSISTVRSASFNFDGKETLLPTVSDDGRLLTDDQAVDLYKKTGKHLGKFSTPDAADAYAVALHNQQAGTLGPYAPGAPGTAEDAAQRRYAADQKVADVDDQAATNAADASKADETERAKKAELLKAQTAETAAEDARQQAGLARATAERDAMRAGVQGFKFHNFWDTRSTGQSILAGIGIILGSASYSQQHQNEAVKTIDNAISNEWDQQKADLDRKFKLAQASGEDLKDLQSQYAVDSGKLKLRQEQQLTAVAAEMDALASRSKNQAGVLAAQKIAAEARALAEQHGQQGVKDIAEAHSAALKDELTKAETTEALAKAGKLKRAGVGGGNGDALAAFVEAAGKLKPGDPIPSDVARLAAKAGVKVKDIATQVDKYRNSGAKSGAEAAKSEGAEQKLTKEDKDTVYIDGKPVGLAPSGKGGAAAFGTRIVNYRDAVKSLQDLKTYVEQNPVAGKLPKGDRYDRAVLAVATTTTANASDKTTTHEANTLKGLVTVTPDAIQRTLDHIKERQKEFMGQLRPLPGTKGAGGFANGPASAGPQEGATATSGGKPIIFRGGKWVPNG